MSGFDLAQTFFVDRQAVNGSELVFLTSVDLFFFSKPVANETKTGITKPGVSVYVCVTNSDGTPNLRSVFHTFSARKEYDDISVSSIASIPTKFVFRQPVPLTTNRVHSILIKFDGSDDEYKLWYNKAGENVLGTTSQTQVSSGKVDGQFYRITNGFDLTPEVDADLMFTLRIARFSQLSKTFKTKNNPYEILKVSSYTSKFLGGEDVYQLRSNGSGTINTTTGNTITGTGTSFNTYLKVSDKIIITDGTTGNTDLVTVTGITNSTSMSVDRQPKFSNTGTNYFKTVVGKVHIEDRFADHVLIRDSNSNSTLYLSTSNTIIGVDSGASAVIDSIVDFRVNAVIPSYNVVTPYGTSYTGTINFANTTNSVDVSNKKDVINGVRQLVNEYPARFASRTTEVRAGTPFQTFSGELTFQTSNEYVSPYVREENLDLFIERYLINNDDTNEYKGGASALARYVSLTTILRNNQTAEDLKVYLTAQRPFGSDIKVYVRFKNSSDNESLNIKDWTELTLENTEVYTNPANIRSRVDLAYSVPFYRSGTDINDNFQTFSGTNNYVRASGTLTQPSTFNALSGITSSVITTSSSHGVVNGDIVQYVVATGNTFVSGLSNGSNYYVVNSTSSTTLQLATSSGGTPITLTPGSSETGHTLIPAKAIVANSLVRIYSPLLPNTYIVDVVTSVVNTTTFAVSRAVTNTDLITTGLKVTKIDRPQSAFLDIQNDNILTYFNKNSARFEGFDMFAVKLVLLSEDTVSVPFVDDVRAVAVSA